MTEEVGALPRVSHSEIRRMKSTRQAKVKPEQSFPPIRHTRQSKSTKSRPRDGR
ncbi:hypothetical protein J6590_081906 [Homalodisca vitripennis]|nr:hypothetical protein J6590_081906 [Homalodisca vitripennis]